MKGARVRNVGKGHVSGTTSQQERRDALQRQLDAIASEIAARSATPQEAALACEMAARFHSLDHADTWLLVERVMVAVCEKAKPV